MKKLLVTFYLLFIVLLLQHNTLQAQVKKPGLLLGVNMLYSAPQGSMGNNYKGGAGVEALGGVGLGKTYLVATIGYERFFSKAGAKDIIYQPIKLGLRQYVIGKRIFVNADVGRAQVKDKTKGITESRLTRGFGAGVRLAGFEGALYYDGWKNGTSGFSNSVQYKLGWNFSI